MNSLQAMYESLRDNRNQVQVDAALAAKAMVPLQRMLDFSQQRRLAVTGKA